MSELKNPAGLNAFQQFRQANSLFKKTSRAKNPAWYREALAHDFQLHIRTDGANTVAFLHDHRENLWAPGPGLTEQTLLDPEAMTAYTLEALKYSRTAGAKSLGVILHIADEFALTEIGPDLTDRDDLPAIRAAAVSDPLSILADSSADTEQFSWRVLPYLAPASQSIGTAVTISHRYSPTLEALRHLGQIEDFPVIVAAFSAPLVALLALADKVKRTEGRPSIAILQYPAFTVLAFFNERADLLQIRTQLHRGLRRPPNFRHAIATTNASLELLDPDLFVFPLGEDVDHALAEDLSLTFPKSHVQIVALPDSSPLPAWCAECVLSTDTEEPDFDQIPGMTFRALREEGWAFQDFLPSSPEIAAIFPTHPEMKLLRGLRYARYAAALATLAMVGWFGFQIIQIAWSPEGKFDPKDATLTTVKLAALNTEKQKIEKWDGLLEDRSKAWLTLECISRLFPENSGIIVRSAAYVARPDNSPGQAKLGFIREWKIGGYASDKAIDTLNALNTREAVAARFNKIADDTGSLAFRTDIGNRTIMVNLRTQENSMFRRTSPANDDLVEGGDNSANGSPYTFDLTITQRFEATDPLGISVAKAP